MMTEEQVDAVTSALIPLMPEMVETIQSAASALRDGESDLAFFYVFQMQERMAVATNHALRLLQQKNRRAS